jgi:quercetin dioxygenase-like cupin family protein
MILKIDPKTVGASQFVVGIEIVPAGAPFPAHRHPNQEEILFVHKGTLTVAVGDAPAREAVAGSLVFIPKNTCVRVQNKGSESATFVFAFPQTGMEQFFNRVRPTGGTPQPTPEERAAIRREHRHEIDFACAR